MADNDPSARPSLLRVAIATVRMVLTAAVLVTIYYVVPMDFTDTNASTIVRLMVGVVVFAGLMSWQLREITRADYPALRAFEALFLAVPLFLLLFASTYFLMGKSDPANFSEPLTRTDALYFTITIFSTVGFGDITPKVSSTRLVASAQMLLDLIVLGTGVRIILNAVERGRDRRTGENVAEVAD